MNMTVKGFPGALHQKLKQRAEARGRTLNEEIISLLETALNPERMEPSERVERLAAHRKSMPSIVDSEALERIIAMGRS